MKLLSLSRLLLFLLVFVVCGPARAEEGAKLPPLYDESADGAKQVNDALVTAKREGKHVLLQFGANWCGWCRKLHHLFDSDKDIANVLRDGYVVVLVDVNKGHNQETDLKYGRPTQFGLPAIVVLDSDGNRLVVKDSGELEEGDHHSPAKVLAFLKAYAPKRQS
jgi:thiol:disulfide interchange protein